jgi:hypothetical protein
MRAVIRRLVRVIGKRAGGSRGGHGHGHGHGHGYGYRGGGRVGVGGRVSQREEQGSSVRPEERRRKVQPGKRRPREAMRYWPSSS